MSRISKNQKGHSWLFWLLTGYAIYRSSFSCSLDVSIIRPLEKQLFLLLHFQNLQAALSYSLDLYIKILNEYYNGYIDHISVSSCIINLNYKSARCILVSAFYRRFFKLELFCFKNSYSIFTSILVQTAIPYHYLIV